MTTFNEAKKLANQKPAANYLTVRIDYDKHIVLPYKEGLKFLEALESAELLKGNYSFDHRIEPLTRSNLGDDTLNTKILPHAEYVNLKMAALLNVNVADLSRIESGTVSVQEAQNFS